MIPGKSLGDQKCILVLEVEGLSSLFRVCSYLSSFTDKAQKVSWMIMDHLKKDHRLLEVWLEWDQDMEVRS